MSYILYFFQAIVAVIFVVLIIAELLKILDKSMKRLIHKYFPLQKEKVPMEIYGFGIYNFNNRQEINFSLKIKNNDLSFKPNPLAIIFNIITPAGQLLINFSEQISCYNLDEVIHIEKDLTPAQMRRILDVYPDELSGVDEQDLFLQLYVFYEYYDKKIKFLYHATAALPLYTEQKEQND